MRRVDGGGIDCRRRWGAIAECCGWDRMEVERCTYVEMCGDRRGRGLEEAARAARWRPSPQPRARSSCPRRTRRRWPCPAAGSGLWWPAAPARTPVAVRPPRCPSDCAGGRAPRPRRAPAPAARTEQDAGGHALLPAADLVAGRARTDSGRRVPALPVRPMWPRIEPHALEKNKMA